MRELPGRAHHTSSLQSLALYSAATADVQPTSPSIEQQHSASGEVAAKHGRRAARHEDTARTCQIVHGLLPCPAALLISGHSACRLHGSMLLRWGRRRWARAQAWACVEWRTAAQPCCTRTHLQEAGKARPGHHHIHVAPPLVLPLAALVQARVRQQLRLQLAGSESGRVLRRRAWQAAAGCGLRAPCFTHWRPGPAARLPTPAPRL